MPVAMSLGAGVPRPIPLGRRRFRFAMPFGISMHNGLLRHCLAGNGLARTRTCHQPETVVTQVLTGTFADGFGTVHRVPDRIGFGPFRCRTRSPAWWRRRSRPPA